MSGVLLQFVHISDTHLLKPGQALDFGDIGPEWAEYARQVLALRHDAGAVVTTLVREINSLPARLDFVLHTGDVAGQPQSPDDYDIMARWLGQINYPLFYLPGNHDDADGVRRLLNGAATPETLDYTFECNGVQIVCLDSNHSAVPHGGGLDDRQLTWLESICAAQDDRPLVVSLHHHPIPLGVPWLDALALSNGDDLHRILLLARARLRGVFFGHIHYGIDVLRDGILYSSAPGAWYQFSGWPGWATPALDDRASPGFSVVTITRDRTFVRRHFYRV